MEDPKKIDAKVEDASVEDGLDTCVTRLAGERHMVEVLGAKAKALETAIDESPIGRYLKHVKDMLAAAKELRDGWKETAKTVALVGFLTEGDLQDNKQPHSAVGIKIFRKVAFTSTLYSDVYLARYARANAPHWLTLDRRIADKEITARFKAAFDGLDADAAKTKLATMSEVDQKLWAMVGLVDDPRVTISTKLGSLVPDELSTEYAMDDQAWLATARRLLEEPGRKAVEHEETAVGF